MIHHSRTLRAGTLFALVFCPALLAASTALADLHVFRHPTLGFEITYPDGYTAASRQTGVLVQATPDFQRDMEDPDRTIRNRALEITILPNPQGATPLEWARKNDQRTNWSFNRSGAPDFIDFGGRRALTYTWCNRLCGDALVFDRGDGHTAVFIDTVYKDENDPARAELKRVASSIRFAENQPVQPPGGMGGGVGQPPPVVVTPPPTPPPGAGMPDRITVLSATYGNSCRAPVGNWTANVARECDGQGRCDFAVDNRYGDPAPNCAKDFVVDYRCGNEMAARRATHPPQGYERYVVTLACGPQQPARGIEVLASTYGASCRAPSGNWTAILARECNGRERCEYRVDTRFGDPAPGCAKDFAVEWRCPGEPTSRRLTGTDGYPVMLSCEVGAPQPPPQPMPPPEATGPAPGEVWLYTDCNFGGRVKQIYADQPFLADFHKQISAVRVGPGTAITLYSSKKFGGRSIVVDRDEACLTTRRFNDQAQSIRITAGRRAPVGPGPGEIWVYTECDFQGEPKRITTDQAELDDELQDEVSGVRVGPDTTVILYQREDYRGRSLVLNQDEACLTAKKFNKRAASLQIRRR